MPIIELNSVFVDLRHTFSMNSAQLRQTQEATGPAATSHGKVRPTNAPAPPLYAYPLKVRRELRKF
jgi:hypothetical protein